jgi:uncharacterized delta-60 repeat protein
MNHTASSRNSRFTLKILCALLPAMASAGVVGCGDDDDSDGTGTGGTSSTGGVRATGGVVGTGGKLSTGGTSSGGAGRGGASTGGTGGSGATTAGGAGGDYAGGAGGEPEVTGGSGGAGGDEVGGAGGAGGGSEPKLNCVRDPSVEAKVLPLAGSGHDGLFGVTFDAEGNLYATGYVQSGIAGTDNRKTVVAKFDGKGELVSSFGDDGLALVDVVAAGNGEMPRGIALQSDGKIVIAGAVEHSATATGIQANDRDLFVFRLTSEGELDSSFGTGGIQILNLNDGVEGTNAQGNPALIGADGQWGLNVDATDRVLVYGQQRATGLQSDGSTPRMDTDFALVRLSKDGAVDSTFATAGKFTYDIGQASVSARTATLLADGSIVCSGYSTYSGVQRPVLFKLGPNGEGPLWVFSEPVGSAAEAYGAALQSDGKFVTAGYGRPSAAATSTDLLSIRLTSYGTLDTTYGQNGATWFDAGGFGDNGRSLLVLGDNRVVLVGGGRLTENDVDGLVTVLTPNGAPDTSFAPGGCRVYDFGTSNDFLWGAALSPNKSLIALVGITGVPTASADDNDSALVLLPVQ